MDALRLLGGLLGNNSLGGALGGQVLNSLTRGMGARRGGGTAASLLGGLAVAAVQHYMRQSRTEGSHPLMSQLAAISPPTLDQQHAEPQARLLIEAMIGAARADGEVDRDEQSRILGQLGELDADEMRFLQETMQRPVDLDDLARRTPSALRGALYAAALSAIRVDTLAESRFLQKLAHKLGLSAQDLADIHDDLGLPPPSP